MGREGGREGGKKGERYLEFGDAVGRNDGLELIGLKSSKRSRLDSSDDGELSHGHHQPGRNLAGTEGGREGGREGERMSTRTRAEEHGSGDGSEGKREGGREGGRGDGETYRKPGKLACFLCSFWDSA